MKYITCLDPRRILQGAPSTVQDQPAYPILYQNNPANQLSYYPGFQFGQPLTNFDLYQQKSAQMNNLHQSQQFIQPQPQQQQSDEASTAIPPKEIPGAPNWLAYHTTGGQVYYYNLQTLVTQWEHPLGENAIMNASSSTNSNNNSGVNSNANSMMFNNQNNNNRRNNQAANQNVNSNNHTGNKPRRHDGSTSQTPLSSSVAMIDSAVVGGGAVGGRNRLLVDGNDMGGHFIENTDGCNLFIFHLPSDWSDTNLYEAFAPFGRVSSSMIVRERESGRNKGFGFVCYSNPQDATVAIERMNGFAINGKRLTVQLKQHSVRRSTVPTAYGSGGSGSNNQQFNNPNNVAHSNTFMNNRPQNRFNNNNQHQQHMHNSISNNSASTTTTSTPQQHIPNTNTNDSNNSNNNQNNLLNLEKNNNLHNIVSNGSTTPINLLSIGDISSLSNPILNTNPISISTQNNNNNQQLASPPPCHLNSSQSLAINSAQTSLPPIHLVVKSPAYDEDEDDARASSDFSAPIASLSLNNQSGGDFVSQQ